MYTKTDFVLKSQKRKTGFSLLELLAVVTIMGILVVIAVPRIATHAFTAKVQTCKQYKGDLNSALERYFFDKGVFPTKVSDLEDPDYYPAEIPRCPADNTAYQIDTNTHRVTGHDHY